MKKGREELRSRLSGKKPVALARKVTKAPRKARNRKRVWI
jgi:hypothetical protein